MGVIFKNIYSSHDRGAVSIIESEGGGVTVHHRNLTTPEKWQLMRGKKPKGAQRDDKLATVFPLKH